MPTYKWFCEKLVPGKRADNIRHCFLIKKLIFQKKTKFQKVLIFENPIYGRVFCLDDIVQLTKKDEFIYSEMMAHPVLFSHKKPERILIIGGGDGGVLREVLKHPVKKVNLVEIDKEIIEISKKYLKFCSEKAFLDKRVKIYNLPGEEFVKNSSKDFYDVILVDCTNFSKEISFPLFGIKFYKDCFSILKSDGILITLGASFLDLKFIKEILRRIKRSFPFWTIYRFCMPSYHCGEYCFIGGSKKVNLKEIDYKKIEKRFKMLQKRHKFKYYSPKIHFTSQVLPKVWQIEK